MTLEDNNLYGRILVALFQQIQAEVPEIRWIAEDLAQLEDFDTRPPVAFPCALIDFPDTSFSEVSENGQRGKLTINIRLGFDAYLVANAAAPDYPMEQTLARYHIEQKLVAALHGWGVENLCQPMSRMSAVTERRNDGCRVRVLQFETEYEDNNMQEVYATRSVNIKITGGVKPFGLPD